MVFNITEIEYFFIVLELHTVEYPPIFFSSYSQVLFYLSVSCKGTLSFFLSFLLFFFFFFLISCRNSLLQVKENSKHLWPKKRSMNLVCILGVVPSHLFWQFVKNIKCKLLHFFTHETSWILCIFLIWVCKP